MTTERDVTDGFLDLTSGLQGLDVSLPWKGAGSAIFLELGEVVSPTGNRQYGRGEACIAVEWDWRVEARGKVLYGSSNTGPEIANGIAGLRTTKIANLTVEGAIPELTVSFDNGQILRTMSMLAGDPNWHIRLACGNWLHAREGAVFDGSREYEMSDAERASFDAAESAATRWGRPSRQPLAGQCSACRWFVRLDGDGHLLDYGACIAGDGPLDGRVVHLNSGCPAFTRAE
ncbi:hypothetical protein BVER_06338c [Candidatus Burkholderia verschuerenii]|uniref:DUF3027 domain-containing protein n=1 Tax=Candidatus Burkholderia verschuerenii TaxID=242163 RepID=A0A0L0M8J2_9BURK|nr:DUF3027 domain-containing protein [Candidatus Burkholderia verschuerenii]KND58591.1 hypothetical protein BVER_06338c [Candidatus Burkholderia verschuerenii]